MSISDQVFRDNLDKAFREQGFLKKEREELIAGYLFLANIDRDDILDIEERKAREVVAKKKELKSVPSEFKEQSDFVAWFRQTYPDVLIYAVRNGGSRTPKEKTEQIMEGVVAGVADLHVPKWKLYIEFKRVKGGVLSEKQAWFRDYVVNECNSYWILAEGFEKGKKLIFDHVMNTECY